MQFSINIANMKDILDAITVTEIEMRVCRENLENINLIRSDVTGDLMLLIKEVAKEIQSECISLALLRMALEQSTENYAQTEKMIINSKGMDTSKKDSVIPINMGADQPSTIYEYTCKDGSVITFKIGDPKAPEYKYDDDFAHDPNAEPEIGDYINWVKWKVINEGAQHVGEYIGRDLPDGVRTYEHYRSGTGTDLEIDYARACEDDKNIRAGVNKYLADTQGVVEEMINSGMQPPFSISSELLGMGGEYYPSTENWQKAIGGHNIWIAADVTMDSEGNIKITSTVHEIDRYNFNKGMQDIVSGASDNENGRFEELGWAKSFNTVGEAQFELSWQKGEVDKGNSSLQGSDPTREDRYSTYSRDYRESRDVRDSSKYREVRNSRER